MSIYFNNLIVPICNLSIFFIHFESQFFVFKTFQIVFIDGELEVNYIYWLVFKWRELRSLKLNFFSAFINSIPIFLIVLKFRNSTFEYLYQSSNQNFSSFHGSLPARGTKTNRAHPFDPFNFSEMIDSRPS